MQEVLQFKQDLVRLQAPWARLQSASGEHGSIDRRRQFAEKVGRTSLYIWNGGLTKTWERMYLYAMLSGEGQVSACPDDAVDCSAFCKLHRFKSGHRTKRS